MFETTDRFVKQTPHTLYLTLEKLNDWSVHFAEKSEKAVRFPRQLFTSVLSWLPFAATEWISINATKRCCNKKATNTTNFFQVIVRQSLSLWDTKTFVSSANNISCNIVDLLIISLMLYRWCICKFCIDKNSLRVLRPYRAQPSHCFWWIECNRAKENQRFHMFAPACKWI